MCVEMSLHDGLANVPLVLQKYQSFCLLHACIFLSFSKILPVLLPVLHSYILIYSLAVI